MKAKLLSELREYIVLVVYFLMVIALTGCGTTKWTDTSRTATEQLLLSNAMDRAVGNMNFSTLLFNKSIWIDNTAIVNATDSPYFVSAIRQHLLANGAKIMEKKEEADYIVELRAGAVGTNRNDLMIGVPALNVPTGWAQNYFSGATAVPEIAIYKKTQQRAVVKVAAFVYNRKTNAPLWQSGNIQTESRVRDVWAFGAGPFSRGDICRGTELAGSQLSPTITQIIDLGTEKSPAPSVTLPVLYKEHEEKESSGDIPIPSLTFDPLTEAEPVVPDKPQEMLVQSPSGDESLVTTSPVAPLPGYVPIATLLPWQSHDHNAPTQLAPGFGNYLR